ncbi:MAG: L-arabinose isomerase [Firmicutes bacterium]|nr:L-arabinose isomerase [Bacillota bacterium]
MINDFKDKELWFVTGSQLLYGEDIIEQITEHSRIIAKEIEANKKFPIKVVFKAVVTNSEAIRNLFFEANCAKECIGIITWMHTFSPAKMWIAGLNILNKPLLHLHTQFNRDIPWADIDMDFMNLNQSAHGDREYGYITSRMKKASKVVVGFWQDQTVLDQIAAWARAALAWADLQGARFARFGDNMRDVAVTEGDKVEAEIKLGYSVNGYAVGDLVKYVNAVSKEDIDTLLGEYKAKYCIQPELLKSETNINSLRESAKIELGIKRFLEDGNFKGFTTTFENLYGLSQLPGLAVQRLMAMGYGFGAEGDWKTAALLRAMKVMAYGLNGGTSFMEDYTYHLEKDNMMVLSAHMLEVCESIAAEKPSLEIHPLSIGGKADPARLVFNVPEGKGINATLVDLGNRFRLLVNEVDVIKPPFDLPKLPVARAIWRPKPSLLVSAQAWILAGGAHHTGFSQAITKEHLEDFSEIADIEYVIIDANTEISSFKKELRWNELFYQLKR